MQCKRRRDLRRRRKRWARRALRWLRVGARQAEDALVRSARMGVGGTLSVRVKGLPFPIEFSDWTHDRLFTRTP